MFICLIIHYTINEGKRGDKMARKKLNDYYLEMRTHELTVPYYNQKRRIRVLLPKDYHKETFASYPVVYLHDGQNVFYSKESFSGYSWKIIPTLKDAHYLPKMIIVGIDNAEENRLNEYGPWRTDSGSTREESSYGGDGMEYGEWLVHTVKPFIDTEYRTLADSANTVLAGSSMGGLITAFIGAKYSDVFGHLGVFSLASWFSERDFLRFIENHPLDKKTNVYIQVGTREGEMKDAPFSKEQRSQQYIDCSLRYYQTLLKQGHAIDRIWLRVLVEERHHEKYWAKHFIEFLQFIFDDKIQRFN